MYSLIIRGGRVLDGTGSPWFAADVAIAEGTLHLLPAGSPAEAQQTVDARGRIVAPGFIDLHTHASLLPFASPGMDPFVRQGVTTVAVGLDGCSYAPLSPDLLRQAVEMWAGVEGTLSGSPGWSSVDEYLRAVDRKAACNVATLVGSGTLRLAAMGWGERPLLPEEQEAAARMLSDALEQGAFGLSSGPACPPGSYAQPAEILRLCQALRPFGGLYVAHLRPGRGEPVAPLQEALDLARGADVRLHVAHLSSPRPGGAKSLLELLDRARCDGLDATFDAQPYPYSSTPLVALLPAWAQAGGPHDVYKRLRDRKERLRIAQDPLWLGLDFRSFLVTNLSRKRHQPFDGWPLESIAQAKGGSVVNTLCDLLLEEQLAPSCVGLSGNPVNTRAFCQHPAHVMASGGAPVGAKCNPRSYGAFPSLLGNLCREEGLLSLPDAVRRMTSLPARRLRLSDRGLLLEGMRADVVVFDPGLVASLADLSEPRRFPQGVEWVVVNGVPVVTPSGATGATPGRGLRHH